MSSIAKIQFLLHFSHILINRYARKRTQKTLANIWWGLGKARAPPSRASCPTFWAHLTILETLLCKINFDAVKVPLNIFNLLLAAMSDKREVFSSHLLQQEIHQLKDELNFLEVKQNKSARVSQLETELLEARRELTSWTRDRRAQILAQRKANIQNLLKLL